MLEKAGTLVAGRNASHHQTATATAQLTQAMVKSIVDSGLVPEGAISLICGSAGDLLDHLDSQDVLGDFHGVSGDRTDAAGFSQISSPNLSPSLWGK